jgi:hypothetical protein
MHPAEIIESLEHNGPMTGAELLERTRMDPLPLWRLCRGCDAIRFEVTGRRYLRLDRALEGVARLSPSIRREFLTYTVVGLASQPAAIQERARTLAGEIERISRFKSNLARENMASILADPGIHEVATARIAFLIAGDITYGMAHAVPRPEPSTGHMVRGSDLDIIVVATDDCPGDILKKVDDAIYRRKHFLLVHPDYREEIDYVIKRLSRVGEQLRFDTFEHRVASKILHEGQMLCGSREVFETIKGMVRESGAPAKLAAMEARAVEDRRAAEASLLGSTAEAGTGDHFYLFYTREERDEIY